MADRRPVAASDAFDDEPDLREARFELVDADLTRANPRITADQVELVRQRVAAGLSVHTDPRGTWFRQPRVRQLSTLLVLAGIVLVVLGALSTGVLIGVGATLLALGLAGTALGHLPPRPRLAGVTVRTHQLGWTWSDRRLRTSIRSISTVWGSRAMAEGYLDAPAVKLSLTDQLADLRLRTALINDLSGEIDALPRADRRDLAHGLNEAKLSMRERTAVLGRYAEQVRQLDAHLDHLDVLATKERLAPRVDELRAQAAADPYHREDVARLAVDARTAAETLRELIGQTQSELISTTRAAGVDLAALVRRAATLLRRPSI